MQVNRTSRGSGRLLPGAALLLVAVWSAACSSLPPPVVDPLRDLGTRAPVVFVPGVTGAELRERATGRIVWGRGKNFVGPHDLGYGVIRSLVPGAERRIEQGDVIEEIRLLGIIRKPIYGPLVELFAANGYERGSLEEPGAGGSFFLFSYDWRGDNVEAARLLAAQLERLRRARGETRLPVTLVCQSNGAHICRYLAKFGGATLDEVEAGRSNPPESLEIRGIILVGTSNGGGLRILRELNRGRRYIAAVGRRLSPEAFFTVESLFQDLPVYRRDLFVDEAGVPLDVDLFDPASWQTYEWSIFAPGPRERVERDRHREIFGEARDRSEHLERMLDRAQRLHRALRRDVPGFGRIPYYLVQSSSLPTPERAVLVAGESGWRTLFTGDRELAKRPDLQALVTAPGDGHATVESQLWLSPQESERLAGDPFEARGEHFDMILDPATQEHLLDLILDIETSSR